MVENFKVTDEDWFEVVKSPKSQVKFQLCLRCLSDTIDLNNAKGFDFGCGEGTFVRILREKGAVVEGCDISDTLVPTDDPELFVGGVDFLTSVPSNSKDFFVAMQIIAFLNEEEQQQMLREASRILKTNGLMLILTSNEHALPVGTKKVTSDPLRFHLYLSKYGLREVRQDFYNCLRQWYYRILPSNRGWKYDLALCDKMPSKYKQTKCSAYISVSVKS